MDFNDSFLNIHDIIFNIPSEDVFSKTDATWQTTLQMCSKENVHTPYKHSNLHQPSKTTKTCHYYYSTLVSINVKRAPGDRADNTEITLLAEQ